MANPSSISFTACPASPTISIVLRSPCSDCFDSLAPSSRFLVDDRSFWFITFSSFSSSSDESMGFTSMYSKPASWIPTVEIIRSKSLGSILCSSLMEPCSIMVSCGNFIRSFFVSILDVASPLVQTTRVATLGTSLNSVMAEAK